MGRHEKTIHFKSKDSDILCAIGSLVNAKVKNSLHLTDNPDNVTCINCLRKVNFMNIPEPVVRSTPDLNKLRAFKFRRKTL